MLYRGEKKIRKKKLRGPEKLAYRREWLAPAVDAFFSWRHQQRHRVDLLPSDPFGRALGYAAQRETGLRVFLEDPEVAIDTNHLYADNRFMPTGRPGTWLDRAARFDLSA